MAFLQGKLQLDLQVVRIELCIYNFQSFLVLLKEFIDFEGPYQIQGMTTNPELLKFKSFLILYETLSELYGEKFFTVL